MAKSLVEQAANLVQQTEAELLAKRKADEAELRQLLLRNDSPKPGDEQRLAELVRKFGIAPHRLPEALKIAQQMREHEELLGKSDDINNTHYAANQKVHEVTAWYEDELKKLQAERNKRDEAARTELAKASGPMGRLKNAYQYQDNVKADWRALLNGTDRETELRAKREGRIINGVRFLGVD